MTVIAMTREMGTLGKDVAAGLAERLGLKVVHHELVEHDIAERSGLGESLVHRFLEGEASMWERWQIDSRRMSHYTAQEILELAAAGNVVIRGWGATYLLRRIPHVVSVRICAPMPFRARVIMKRMGMSDPAAARREIERNDAAHNGTMQRMYAIDWTDPSLYAVTLNTERVTPQHCVEQIARLADTSQFVETAESRGVLMDQLVETRVRARLREFFTAGSAAIGIDVEVTDGTVVLTGGMSDRDQINEIVQRVRAIEGVRGLECRIQHLKFRRA